MQKFCSIKRRCLSGLCLVELPWWKISTYLKFKSVDFDILTIFFFWYLFFIYTCSIRWFHGDWNMKVNRDWARDACLVCSRPWIWPVEQQQQHKEPKGADCWSGTVQSDDLDLIWQCCIWKWQSIYIFVFPLEGNSCFLVNF